jgi:hypothetical protein
LNYKRKKLKGAALSLWERGEGFVLVGEGIKN